ncbi:hypothetical protein PTKIN_Ptkin19aG0035800 [Pterospermum kingtungense]
MTEPKWFWILVTVFLLEGWSSKGCLEHERIALLQLKFFFDNPDSLSNWVDVKGSDCCQWERVECNITSRQVIRLFLNSTRHMRRPYGNLNASLFLPFEKLKSLYLSGNQIAGFVNNEGFAKLSSVLENLEILDLGGNYFNDSILLSLTKFLSLKSLYLSYNKFSGESTNYNLSWFSRPSNLETLDLSGNHLKNNFLFYVGGLSSLRTLNLGLNELTGSLDIRELNSLMNLRNLDLSGNAIESIYYFQGGQRRLMINLEVLDLSHNLFRNTSFANISGLSNLRSLNIGSNQLQGFIDIEELNNLAKLKKLNMWDNRIESLRSFPGTERRLTLINLEELELSDKSLQYQHIDTAEWAF